MRKGRKLTEEQVRRIRFFPRTVSLKRMQTEFQNVSLVTLHKIRTGQSYRDVKPMDMDDAMLLVAQGKAEYARPIE